jgi:prepilin-type N-terminal cleavage/methylation domain-containing protein
MSSLGSQFEVRRSVGWPPELRASRSPRAPRGGFTLVELLVVIGVIAVLIGVLLPVLSRSRAAANRAACMSNVKQLYTGILMYCNDNHGWFPTCAYWANGSSYVQYPEDWIHWQANRNIDDSAVAKYVGKGEQLKNLLRCPADTFDGRKAAPSILPGQGPYLYSYNMNDSMSVNAKDPTVGPQTRRKITQWRAGSRKILVTEGIEKFNTAPAWGQTQLARRHGTATAKGLGYTPAGQVMGTNVSAVFLDGHGEPVNEDFARNIFQARPEAQ